jgi:hypothetical protein
MKLRPFKGSWTISRLPMTWPTSLRSVLSSGASAVTVAVSVTPAGERAASTRTRSPVRS